MEQIEDAADRAKRLIKELQAFSLREQSEPAAVDVGQLINDIALLLREVLGEHIPIVTDPGRGLWEVETDRALIEQAVINIALNARDAMPGGGRLTIAARNVDTMNPTAAPSQQGSTHLADLPPSRYVQLCITDTGSGMEAPTAARAFEPFFTTKPADAAAGLGLATVGRIAAQAGGTAWLHSEPGAGTTVSIVLPAALASTPAAPHAAGQPGQVQAPAESVLVVDDDPAVRTAAHRVLSTAGYHVTTAADGPQALALLADPATAPDLILTDVVMPGLTGPAFAARAQALRPGTRVLYMSGYERLGIPTDDWPHPDQLIAKPFSRAALLARVSHALMAGAAAAASGATRPAT
jgi:CheY-like chemotaxis protein